MLADMAFRIVSHIVNLTPMCHSLAIEVGFGTALAKRVSHVRKPVRMPSQRRSEQVVNEQIAPTKWLELMGLGDYCATAVGLRSRRMGLGMLCYHATLGTVRFRLRAISSLENC